MSSSTRAPLRALVLCALLTTVAGCTHDSPEPPPAPTSPPSRQRAASVETARSVGSARAEKLQAAGDAASVRAYLTSGAGAKLVVGQHRAALQLLDAQDPSACAPVLTELRELPPDQAVSAAAGIPDSVTAGLLGQERSALTRVLTGCLHPDQVSEEHLAKARSDLSEAAGVVDLRLDMLGVER